MNDWRLDMGSGVPVYIQLKQQIIQKVMQGEWSPGHQLPTVRQMAVDVRINVNTVSKVYAEVEREGYIRTQQGKGTFVCQSPLWREAPDEREEKVRRFAQTMVEMAQAQGITLTELIQALQTLQIPPK